MFLTSKSSRRNVLLTNAAIAAIIFSFAALILSSCSKEESKRAEKATVSSSIVREGVVDLKSIDANKDGYVYQDQMDWNVISDQPGDCPICGMKLKKVTLEEAKKNLTEHNFKVK